MKSIDKNISEEEKKKQIEDMWNNYEKKKDSAWYEIDEDDIYYFENESD